MPYQVNSKNIEAKNSVLWPEQRGCTVNGSESEIPYRKQLERKQAAYKPPPTPLEFPQNVIKKWLRLPKAPICRFFDILDWQFFE